MEAVGLSSSFPQKPAFQAWKTLVIPVNGEKGGSGAWLQVTGALSGYDEQYVIYSTSHTHTWTRRSSMRDKCEATWNHVARRLLMPHDSCDHRR